MTRPRVYIDGKEGTTGLQIYERLGQREDIELLLIDEEKRKDLEERRRLLNAADLVFLCLPDAAAKEAAGLVENSRTRIIDCSTAHRVDPEWAYGFPELSKLHRERIIAAQRVSNPGCHATGFLSIAYPLVEMGLLPMDAALSCFSLTGYSGGGKKMIGQYEAEDRPALYSTPALYGLMQDHKHLPEMQVRSGLSAPPVFVPIVDDYYKGMATTVPLHMSQMKGLSSLGEVWKALKDYYGDTGAVRVVWGPGYPEKGEAPNSRIYAGQNQGKDTLSILVMGSDERFTLTALFDNLGKGASGAAVQNMNLMLGYEEFKGLSL